MPEKPSDRLVEEAKAFIRKRIGAELSMNKFLEKAMLDAARKIADIAFRYKTPPSKFAFSSNKSLEREVDMVIEDLRDMLLDVCETLATAASESDDDKKDVIAYIEREKYGNTLVGRLNKYLEMFKYELESGILAAMLIDYDKKKVVNYIRENLKNPYKNATFKSASKNGLGYKARRIVDGGLNLGSGRSNVAFNSLNHLLKAEVDEGWMYQEFKEAKRNGAEGFWSYRGSSYPCQTCEDEVGYHHIDEFFGEWHDNCCCIFVFV